MLISENFAQAQSDYGSKKPWVVGGGVGPNFSKIDAVSDELKSSFGATLWLQRDFEDDYRMDLAVDYFDFEGGSRDFAGLSLGYGMRFFEGDYMSPFALIGIGAGLAQNFPREVDTHQAEIKEEFLVVVKEFADYLNRQSDLQVTIEGHTDSIGAKEWNRKLSQMRADAVREKLVKDYGVAASRITSVGYGPDRPEKSNDTKANRQKNRRVVAVLK